MYRKPDIIKHRRTTCLLAGLSLMLPFSACDNSKPVTKTQSATVATIARDTVSEEQELYRAADVVIADTGIYNYLLQQMLRLSTSALIPFDTLTNMWDSSRNQLINKASLDDSFATLEYYPRLDTGLNLSIEYLGMYDTAAHERFCIVAAVCYTRTQADSILTLLKPHAQRAYVQHTKLYMGCML